MDPARPRPRVVAAHDRRLLLTLLVPALTLTITTAAAEERTRLPLLTEIRAIRALSQDDGARGYPVRLRGTISHFDEIGKNSLILHDGTLGQFVINPPPATVVDAWNDLRTGDFVEIHGRTVRGGFAPNVEPAQVSRLGPGTLPPARTIPYSAMLTGRHDCEYVEISGIVQRAWLPSAASGTRLLFADVDTEDGMVRALFWGFEPADLGRFIDARVRMRGNVGTIFGHTEQLSGVSVFAGRTADLVVLEPAPDPFRLNTRPIRGIYNYSPAGEVNRRIRVRGVVTAVVPGHPVDVRDFTTTSIFRHVRHSLYVNDASGGARIETEQVPLPQPGDRIDAAGFAAVTPAKPILKNAVFRVIGRDPTPAPISLTGAALLQPDNDAAMVRIDAHLLSVLTGPTERMLVLKAGEAVFNAALDASGAAALDHLRAGTLLSVAGVYAYQAGPPPSFRLHVPRVEDIRILASAPWWTLRHTLVTGVMFACVAGFGAVGVHTHTRRKRREYQAVLSERTRVARELHDTLEQGLAGIALQLEAVAGSLKSSPERARRSLDVARQMLRYSLEETRRSVMDLRSQALESRDLAGALTSLAQQMTVGTRAQAAVRVTGAAARLDAAEEHHLLRIGLEALTNAVKHARPARIDIELAFEPDATRLVVQDDGCGFEEGRPGAGRPHFGLQGVRERVDKLGGRLEVESAAGCGTRLAVHIPHHQRRGQEIGERHAGGG